VKRSVAGSMLGRNASVFCSSLYSPTRCGRLGCATLISRAQPQGQPNDDAVKVP
jgi:hypothetical protein